MKKYLLCVKSSNGAVLNNVGNTDSTRPIQVNYCGADTGERYLRIGSASRHIEKIADGWGCEVEKIYGTADDIPLHGCSEWNKHLFKVDYCGAKLFG